jgi:hypothetical protein
MSVSFETARRFAVDLGLKWNGYWAVAVNDSIVRLYSRNGKLLDKKFPETVADGVIARVQAGAVIVAANDGGRVVAPPSGAIESAVLAIKCCAKRPADRLDLHCAPVDSRQREQQREEPATHRRG